MTDEQREIVTTSIAEDGFEYTFLSKDSFEWIDDKEFHLLIALYKGSRSALARYLEKK